MNPNAPQFDNAKNYPDDDAAFAPLIDSAPFEVFDLAMDDALAVLVGRWVHLAAPKAANTRLRSFNLTHPKKAK